MTDSRTPTILLAPRIPTRGRTILPPASRVGLLVLGLYMIPLIGFLIAAADTRLGFRILMASLAIAMLMLILGLQLRLRGLRAGAVRIESTGALHFVPARSHWVVLVVVPLVFLIPATVLLLIPILGLPTQASSSLRMGSAPYLLFALSIGLLAKVVWSMRTPVGLRVGVDGLGVCEVTRALTLDGRTSRERQRSTRTAQNSRFSRGRVASSSLTATTSVPTPRLLPRSSSSIA